MRQLQVCVLLYREDNGVWPGSFEDLSPYTKELSGGDEFNPTETISHDAWGNLTVMEPPTGEKGTGRLTSYGKDGKPGGEGMNADIVVEFSVVDVTGGKKTGK